jgi:hypothetical protein
VFTKADRQTAVLIDHSGREAPGRLVSGATNQIVRPPDGTYRACQLARVHVVPSWNSRMPPNSASRAAIAKEKEEQRRNEEVEVDAAAGVRNLAPAVRLY